MNVIFDMDGVIFDTERFYIECCKPAAQKCGLENIEEVSYKCIGLTEEATAKTMMDYYGEDAPLEEFYMAMVEEFNKRYDENGLPVKVGVREILEWLNETGASVALASSTKTEIVKRELADAGLDHYFDVIIGGDTVSNSKPAPDIFLKAAELLGQRPEDCIVIEDSYNGVKAAHAAGTRPIMVPDLLEPTDEIKKLTYMIKSSLLEVLDEFRIGIF